VGGVTSFCHKISFRSVSMISPVCLFHNPIHFQRVFVFFCLPGSLCSRLYSFYPVLVWTGIGRGNVEHTCHHVYNYLINHRHFVLNTDVYNLCNQCVYNYLIYHRYFVINSNVYKFSNRWANFFLSQIAMYNKIWFFSASPEGAGF
jgi:hypothetical protein